MNKREVLELMRDAASGCDTFEDFVTAIHNKLAALPAAAQADGEEPSIEACQSAYWLAFNAHGSSDQPVLYAINAVRDLMLRARPAPSHALVEAGDAMREVLYDIAAAHDPEALAAMSAWDRARKGPDCVCGHERVQHVAGSKACGAMEDCPCISYRALPAAKKEGGA